MTLPFVAALLFQNGSSEGVLPKPLPLTVPNDVRDWAGFKYLPPGPREVPKAFPSAGDWSGVRGEIAPGATVWRTKLVILDRIDRVHERGPGIVWPGHHGFPPYVVDRIKRALPQMRARVADLTGGAVNVKFDVVEETEALTTDGDLPSVVSRYLTPRINGGKFDAEDGVFRGPFQSVLVVHPMGGEPTPLFEVQSTPVTLVGLPDQSGEEIDGALANFLTLEWMGQVVRRAADAGATPVANGPFPASELWPAIARGGDDTPEERLRMLGVKLFAGEELVTGGAWNERGAETTAKLAKDPQRGQVLVVDELGPFRQGGVALPAVQGATLDGMAHRTFAFWAKSDAKDPIVFQFDAKPIRLGTDVPFAYDNAWHHVGIDIRSFGRVAQVLIAPDASARSRVRETLGPIEASFSDFEATDEKPDPKPIPEASAPAATDPEARARWAATAGPGEARRALMKDPIDAVRANATAAAFARPDPADEPTLIENALYTFEPTLYTPALKALAKANTPTARDGLKQALRIAAADRARGLAAELLAASGDPRVVPLMVGLNQSRTRAARIEAVRALGTIPGSEAALMRMAYLAQEDPEVKLETTLTADPNDDYQGRKLLWSAVNEPSDAVRLESLRRLSTSSVPEFRTEGLNGVRDDSVGVRVGLLGAWTATPSVATLPAIRIALRDPSPRVRAAALAALAANAAPVEVANALFDDGDPRVQIQAIRLARAKGLVVPPETRRQWRESPDPTVRAAAG